MRQTDERTLWICEVTDLPNPPASGGNVGDGDSDRFDHLFFVAAIDQVTLTPGGVVWVARGFLRTRTDWRRGRWGGVALGVTAQVQGDDDTDGVIIFEALDAGIRWQAETIRTRLSGETTTTALERLRW